MSFFKDKVQSAASLEACSSGNNQEDAVAAIKIVPVANSVAANIITISNAAYGQATTLTIPDPGVAAASFVLSAGTGAQPSPATSTITAAAGATNTATVTIQLKDSSGNNLAAIIPFEVYASSAANGLTLASAASTGFSVASGGLSRANGTAVTTSIRAVTSATGGCVLSLLDTAKQTSYLVLVLANGVKISAQLSAGSYG